MIDLCSSLPATPASPAGQLAVIHLNATRTARALRANPALAADIAEDIREAYLLLVGTAKYAEDAHNQGLHDAGPEVGCTPCEEEQADAADEDEAWDRNAELDAQPHLQLVKSA